MQRQQQYQQQPACATPVRGTISSDVKASGGIAANSATSNIHSNSVIEQQQHHTIVTPGQTSRRYVCSIMSLHTILSCNVRLKVQCLLT